MAGWFLGGLLVLSPGFTARADSIVVFNEVHFHPAANEASAEWLELHNQNAVDVDLGGWSVSDGIDFTFPRGTVIRGGGYLVVGADPASLEAIGVVGVVGPFQGRLGNEGDRLRLRDNVGRVMDELSYGVDGDWPVSPDGAGTSLAKRAPNLASGRAESWTASREIGGTPGTVNFSSSPVLGARTVLLSGNGPWRYRDAAEEPDPGWRDPSYDDSTWASGAAPFAAGTGDVGPAVGTPLTPGRLTAYFRSAFELSGDPVSQVVTFQPTVDDGAILYLNGSEAWRFNLPTGVVNQTTMATSRVDIARSAAPVILPAALLRPGRNTLAVELHQTTISFNTGFRMTPSAGHGIAWDGGNGQFSTSTSPAPVPDNAALASRGSEVFTSSNPTLAAGLTDGRYGTASSWSPAAGDGSAAVVVRFNRLLTVGSVAWGRDNGDDSDAGCPGGVCTNRSLGTYTIQYTLATNPAVVTVNSSNPSNGWVTVSTVQYLTFQPGFSPHLRHRFDITAPGGQPILATGIRIRVPLASTLDEVEINTPGTADSDATFGLSVASRPVLPPPPALAINEVAPAGTTPFWVEVRNVGDSVVDLSGLRVGLSSGSGAVAVPDPVILAPGAMAVARFPSAGLRVGDGDKVFLRTVDGSAILDAVAVQTSIRGRFPDGTGPWRYPAQASPGAANPVQLRHDVVIHEIMYQASPVDPSPAVTRTTPLVSIGGAWRYDDSGTDLGSAWRAPSFDDSGWSQGAGLFAFNTGRLPAATNTALAGGRSTYYFRNTFDFSGSLADTVLQLEGVVDDGAAFFLNGVEIHRRNLPSGPLLYSTPAADAVGDASWFEPVILPANLLVQGRNVLAVEVHQAPALATSLDGLVLSGGGLMLVEEGPPGPVPANLALQPGVKPFASGTLSGYAAHALAHINDGLYGNDNSWIGVSSGPGYVGLRFGGLHAITNIAFGRDNLGTLTDRTLGTYTLQYTRVASPGTATQVTGDAETGWAAIGTIQYQGPGTGLFTAPSRRHRFSFAPVTASGIRLLVPATGLDAGTCIDELEVNSVDRSGDVALGAALSLVTTLVPEVVYQESGEEWLELRNVSASPVDLTGWRLGAAVAFAFTNGPVVPPGGYAVVARQSAALRSVWPEVASVIVGDFSGRLGANERVVLTDAFGNPVDEALVFGGGWSGGGGSSLELRDASADRLNRLSWADSDESGKGAWTTVTYRMVAGQSHGSSRWNEFRIGLLDDGEVMIDDVSVVRDPDGARTQLIQNGGFDITSGNTRWRGLGNHRITFDADPADPANPVLRLSASGRAVMNHNHLETTFAGNTPLVDGQVYEVSFRARWLAGSPQLSTRAYFGRLARVTILPIPKRLGTPGAANSRRVDNAGPTLGGLRHEPVVPAAGQAVTVSVVADDSLGVASAVLSYRVNPALTFTNVPMTVSTGNVWIAAVPGFPAGRVVHFFVSAVDNGGSSSMAPARGPDSRALYQVADNQRTSLPAHELRLIMLDADRNFMLAPTNVMSNARIGGTVVYDRSEVFYDVGARLQGTAASRIRDGDDYVSYDIAFPPDRLFRGVQENIGIDRSGRGPTVRGQDEIAIHHMFHRAGIPCQYTDLCYFISPRTVHTGTAILQPSGYGPGFIEESFPSGGSVFNMDITYEPDSTANGAVEGIKLPVPLQTHEGTDFRDLGDVEQYRSPFDIRSGNRRDDYSGIVRLGRTMGLPQSRFNEGIASALDVSEVLRMTAMELLCGVGDTYISASGSLPHNLRIFTPFGGGPALFLPWDMDFAFSSPATDSILPYSGYNLSKLINTPSGRRRYLHHVHDLCQTVFRVESIGPWLAHYGSVVGQNMTANVDYITARRTFALTQLPPPVPFAILSNGGEGFSVETNRATLSGTAWIDVVELEVNGARMAGEWISSSNWTVAVPLSPGVNVIQVQGLDHAGMRVSNRLDSITITNTSGQPLLPVVINEWMANNGGPGGMADPADGLFQDWFELFNPNSVRVDLGGFHLTDDLARPAKFVIPAGTGIPARGFLLVWADEDGSQNTPLSADLHANFKLSNGGESIGLFAADGVTAQDRVTFGPQFLNVSQGLFPDGAVGTRVWMTNWSPRASNRLGPPPVPAILEHGIAGGVFRFVLGTTPGRSYGVEVSEDLGSGVWSPLGGLRVASGTTLSIDIPLGSQPRRFFRFRLQ